METVNLADNEISNLSAIAALARLPSLRSLTLAGNPVCSLSYGYRRFVLILHRNFRSHVLQLLPKLEYLDDQPIVQEPPRIVTSPSIDLTGTHKESVCHIEFTVFGDDNCVQMLVDENEALRARVRLQEIRLKSLDEVLQIQVAYMILIGRLT